MIHIFEFYGDIPNKRCREGLSLVDGVGSVNPYEMVNWLLRDEGVKLLYFHFEKLLFKLFNFYLNSNKSICCFDLFNYSFVFFSFDFFRVHFIGYKIATSITFWMKLSDQSKYVCAFFLL